MSCNHSRQSDLSAHNKSGSILGSTSMIAAMTMLSRVAGFLRDILLAAILGAGPIADAFVAAFQLPNLFRRLLAEGAFSAAFIPVFTRYLRMHGADFARHFAEQILAIFVPFLLLLTILGLIFTEWLVLLTAPGFARLENGAENKIATTIHLARILFPYLALVSLGSIYVAILQITGRFALASFVPAFMNIFAITGLLIAQYYHLAPAPAVACAITLSGLLQLWLLALRARKIGFPLGLRKLRINPQIRQFFQLFWPGLIAGGVIQINIMIGGAIASFEQGARAWLYYADRIYQLPLALIGIALGTALLPNFSRFGKAQSQLNPLINRSCQGAMLFALPAMAGLIALAQPIAFGLFQRANLTPNDANAIAYALMIYAGGLPAFIMIKILSPVFFAREDTKTPLRLAMYSVLVNIILAVGFFFAFGYLGVVMATSVAAWYHAMLLLWQLRRLGFIADKVLRRRLGKILLLSIVMAIGLHFLVALDPELLFAGETERLFKLIGLILAGMGFFALFALPIGAVSLAELKMLRKKHKST